ncbi:hypothetical protein BAXH7_01136 [Bacillus amyloliquefaciens XH7]|nr:hypothetical protein BAMTA208_05430 [Bacillus amyloliquefaciens TA208]AEB64022.1 hypothetical protein LL3_02489 [Bacillus amyloliquefaciens LL3]AEK88278.1 hypothetical protein BAXH7_01136 [Bacillus amyloliquefaciens XH7]KYC95757.1 hypothetical protein B425_2610 [Bacillus amyloliquefaciens]
MNKTPAVIGRSLIFLPIQQTKKSARPVFYEADAFSHYCV